MAVRDFDLLQFFEVFFLWYLTFPKYHSSLYSLLLSSGLNVSGVGIGFPFRCWCRCPFKVAKCPVPVSSANVELSCPKSREMVFRLCFGTGDFGFSSCLGSITNMVMKNRMEPEIVERFWLEGIVG